MTRLLVLALLACSAESTFEPPDWGLERMLSQPRRDPYEASATFADGRVMQHPPDDTVPHDAAPYDEAIDSGAVGGTLVNDLPIDISAATLVHGRERYDIHCSPCHGILGDADAVVGRNMPLVRPRSLVSPELRRAPAGRIFRAIDLGYGLMASYAASLDLGERWAVVAYVRALQTSSGVELSTLPEALQRAAKEALQ